MLTWRNVDAWCEWPFNVSLVNWRKAGPDTAATPTTKPTVCQNLSVRPFCPNKSLGLSTPHHRHGKLDTSPGKPMHSVLAFGFLHRVTRPTQFWKLSLCGSWEPESVLEQTQPEFPVPCSKYKRNHMRWMSCREQRKTNSFYFLRIVDTMTKHRNLMQPRNVDR